MSLAVPRRRLAKIGVAVLVLSGTLGVPLGPPSGRGAAPPNEPIVSTTATTTSDVADDGSVPVAGTAPFGGCCLSLGNCAELSDHDCAALGGIFTGAGTDCTACYGACCVSDNCTSRTEFDCSRRGGTFQGRGTTCFDLGIACRVGACCVSSLFNYCDNATPSSCATQQGTFLGLGTTCDDVADCSPPTFGGACCYPGSFCEFVSAATCAAGGGTYRGDGADCPTACYGACCRAFGQCDDNFDEFSCLVSYNGTFQGYGSSCSDPTIACAGTPGACCVPFNYWCVDGSDPQCTADGGTFAGAGTTCEAVDLCFGACCSSYDGSCFAAHVYSCPNYGTFQGLATDCSAVACAGACCLPYGQCADGWGQGNCTDVGGTFQGQGSTCADASIACSGTPGACCTPDSGCVNGADPFCTNDGGLFLGGGTTCAGYSDPGCYGACCNLDYGYCHNAWWTDCNDPREYFHGAGTDCSGVACGGACCFADGGCSDGYGEQNCAASNGVFHGHGSTCADPAVTCSGACCHPVVGCFQSGEGTCSSQGGSYLGNGTTCDGGNCPPIGACCYSEGPYPYSGPSCRETTSAGCDGLGGAYRGDGTSCANSCSGACCLPFGCTDDYHPDLCAYHGGSYQGDGTFCDDTNIACSEGKGACCLFGFVGTGERCINALTAYECSAFYAGVFHGEGSTCAGVTCEIDACPSLGSCCSTHHTPGCDDESCCQAVCSVDPHCCVLAPYRWWDDVCVELANHLCGNDFNYCSDCPGNGSCCNAHGDTGCDDAACCRAVCDADAYCCNVEWDDVCARQALANCAISCPPLRRADLNRDGEVDLDDYDLFMACFAGPDSRPVFGCPAGADADLDGDGDVDVRDFRLILYEFGMSS